MLQNTLKRLIHRQAQQQLSRVVERTHAADLAFLLPHFSVSERIRLLETCLDDYKRAEVLSSADAEVAAEILADIPVERAVDLLHRIEPDDASDILQTMPFDIADALLRQMPWSDRTQVEDLNRYDEQTAGGIMSPRFFALHRDTSAREAIEHLQRVSDDLEMVFYVYVVNEVGHLLGVVSLRQLVTTKPDTTLFQLMTSDVISVRPDEDQEEVAKLASRYGFLAVPVVDEANKLIGIVTVDDVIDVLREEATEDILQMAGAGHELAQPTRLVGPIRERLPWVLGMAVSGVIGCALVILFTFRLRTIPMITVCTMPLVWAMSGLIGGQSAAIIAQQIAVGLLGDRILRHAFWQAAVSLLLGACGGVFAIGVLWIARSNFEALAMLTWGDFSWLLGAIVASSVGSGAIGGLLPLILHRLRLDPSLAAGPLGTAAVHTMGLIIFLLVGSAASLG